MDIEFILSKHKEERANIPTDNLLIEPVGTKRANVLEMQSHIVLVNDSKQYYDFERIKSSYIYNILNYEKYNLVMAGGAILAVLIDRTPSDYDFFFFNLKEEEIMANVEAIINDLKKLFMIVVYRSTSVVTIVISNTYVFQFILREYPNKASIIYGFDLSMSQFLYDGSNIYMTKLADASCSYHCNIIDITSRRYNYERRLMKYFIQYSVGIIMPKCVHNRFDLMNIRWLNFTTLSIKKNIYYICDMIIYKFETDKLSIYEYDNSVNYLQYHFIAQHNINMYKNNHHDLMIGTESGVVYMYESFHSTREFNTKVNEQKIMIKHKVLKYDEKSAFQDMFKITEEEWACTLTTSQWIALIPIVFQSSYDFIYDLVESLMYSQVDKKYILRYAPNHFDKLICWCKN